MRGNWICKEKVWSYDTRVRSVLLLIGLTATAVAQSQELTELRKTMRSLAQTRDDYSTTPYAGIATAKRQLLEWVEANLAKFPLNGDEKTFATRLNSTLRAANLTCRPRTDPTDHGGDFCPDDQNNQGYLGDVSIEHKANFLVLTTGVGLSYCETDESAYVYQWTGFRWQLVLRDEQTGTGDAYQPQLIQKVEISRPAMSGSRVALVLGLNFGCSSVLRPIYYRAWRFGGTTSQPKLLLRRSEQADIGGPFSGRAEPNDVMLEFTAVNDKLNVAFRHTAVRHYSLQGDVVRQMDPVAVTPLGFLNEWLDADWSKSAVWSESAALEQWHRSLSGQWANGVRRCHEDASLWQVEAEDGPLYFLVRWKPPYRFTVANISNRGRPDCTIEDPGVEDEHSVFAQPK